MREQRCPRPLSAPRGAGGCNGAALLAGRVPCFARALILTAVLPPSHRGVFPRGGARRGTCGFPAGAAQLPLRAEAPGRTRGRPRPAGLAGGPSWRGLGAAARGSRAGRSPPEGVCLEHRGEEEDTVSLHAFSGVFKSYTLLHVRVLHVRWEAEIEWGLVGPVGRGFAKKPPRLFPHKTGLPGTSSPAEVGLGALGWH